MMQVFQRDSPLLEKPVGGAWRNGRLSLEEMKRLLRNAEERLSGLASPQAKAQVDIGQSSEISTSS